MNFEVNQNLRGCKISSNGNILIYTPRLFSMSGELKNSEGNIITQMKRLKWWHYSFLISTSDETSYVLNRRWGETELMMKNSEQKFQTNGTVEFFSNGMIPATKYNLNKHYLSSWSLEILNREHWQALLIASCFLHKLDIQSVGT